MLYISLRNLFKKREIMNSFYHRKQCLITTLTVGPSKDPKQFISATKLPPLFFPSDVSTGENITQLSKARTINYTRSNSFSFFKKTPYTLRYSTSLKFNFSSQSIPAAYSTFLTSTSKKKLLKRQSTVVLENKTNPSPFDESHSSNCHYKPNPVKTLKLDQDPKNLKGVEETSPKIDANPLNFLNLNKTFDHTKTPLPLKVVDITTVFTLYLCSISVHILPAFGYLEYSRQLFTSLIHLSGLSINFMVMMHIAFLITNFSTSKQSQSTNFSSSLRVASTFVPMLFAINSSASSLFLGPYSLYSLLFGILAMFAVDFSSHKKGFVPPWFLKHRVRIQLAMTGAIIISLLSEAQELKLNPSNLLKNLELI